MVYEPIKTNYINKLSLLLVWTGTSVPHMLPPKKTCNNWNISRWYNYYKMMQIVNSSHIMGIQLVTKFIVWYAVCKKVSSHAPLQTDIAQTSFILVFPPHFPCRQERVLCLFPTPHVTEHGDHEPQTVQLPLSTAYLTLLVAAGLGPAANTQPCYTAMQQPASRTV